MIDFVFASNMKRGDNISQFFEDMKQAIEIDNEYDMMIKATRHNNTTTEQLLDILKTKGVIGVYNLGMADLFQYLSGRQ